LEASTRDILGVTIKRDTRGYYPKRYWEILPKEILGDTTQRDIGRYYPKRYWEILPKEILGDTSKPLGLLPEFEALNITLLQYFLGTPEAPGFSVCILCLFYPKVGLRIHQDSVIVRDTTKILEFKTLRDRYRNNGMSDSIGDLVFLDTKVLRKSDVDLTGDEDPTDKDGDIGVSVSLGDEIFSEGKKSRESNIGDSDNTGMQCRMDLGGQGNLVAKLRTHGGDKDQLGTELEG
ncbi:hypothetical protein Tco_0677196, partial [Tanacetum coccineum]